MTQPAGTGRTMTFLLTDIEGSTRLWEEQRGAMAVALQAHDALLRAAIEGAGGSVAKSTGDGLLAVFEQAAAAIAAAADGQAALDRQVWPTSGPLRVRMAVHSGTAETRDNDYFGPPLNRVARLLAIGHGGQILVSAATCVLAADDLPAGTELLDLGEQSLRDLDRAERVYQLAGPTLRRDFPPLRSSATPSSRVQTNLPAQATSFVGRERELEGMRRLLETARLVTLAGTGGTGKTRLMLEAAAAQVGAYSDGVWLVELAPISDPTLVMAEIMRNVGAQPAPDQPPLEAVLDFLRTKRLLLLLDNCEHLIEAAADAAHRLLGACAHLTIIATSREPLGVEGEAVVSVPSLALPPDPQRSSDGADGAGLVELAEHSDAVRLFVDRAQATLPSFALDPASAGPVIEICRRLDGIPLALELAAARVNVLSVAEIARGLDDRFRLLTGGRRTAVPRQRTLQALVDWSWDLLGEGDRRLLRRLSAFAGGWTLDAAAAVTGEGAGTNSLAVLDGLSRLVDRSLVVAEHEGATRYRMLETIRQYAADQLVGSGEAREVRDRHLDYFAHLAETAAAGLEGRDALTWLTRVDAEVDNLRAALDWAFGSHPETALRVSVSMSAYWRSRAVGSEGLQRLLDAVALARRWRLEPSEMPGAERTLLAAAVLSRAAWAAAIGGHPAAAALGEEAVAVARESKDPACEAFALAVRAWSHFIYAPESDSAEWWAWFQEARRLEEERLPAGDDSPEGNQRALFLGALEVMHDTSANDSLQRLADMARRIGNPYWAAMVLQIQARVADARGRPEAEQLFVEAEKLYRAMADRHFQLSMQSERAHVVRHAGRLDEAEAIYRQTIQGWRHGGNRGAVAHQLESLAFIARARGQDRRAATVLGAADALRTAAATEMRGVERIEYDAELDHLREDLAADAFADAWAAGSALSLDEAVAFAVAD